MKTVIKGYPHLLHGGDYNPEQWTEDIWEKDMEMFQKAGIDITKKEFWQRSFNQIEKTIDEFEALCKENLPGIL